MDGRPQNAGPESNVVAEPLSSLQGCQVEGDNRRLGDANLRIGGGHEALAEAMSGRR